MNRRKWLAAALALCLGTTANVASTLGAETTTSSARYTIGDSGVTKASTASATSAAATTSVAGQSIAQDCCDACDVCDPCCDCYDCCCGPPMWFVEGEALLWWRKSRSLPPLVTTSLPGTPPADLGVLGLDTTRTLFGGENVEDGPRAGGRINFGRWLDADHVTGVGADFFMLEQEEINFTAAGVAGAPIIAIPFFDASVGLPDAEVLNRPGFTDNAQLHVQSQNDVLGGDVYLRRLLYTGNGMRIDAIGGYQFARVDDGLTIRARYDDVVNNANLDQYDSFAATNEFHGGTLGVLARVENGRWSAKGLLKCGLGNMHQSVDVNGQTVVTPLGGGAVAVNPRGFLALPSNIGVSSTNDFVYIPEAKLNLGYRASENWTFGVGYSFMYFSDVMTAGRSINQQINPTQLPPGPLVGPLVPATPNFANSSDFWVQGINFSAEFAY